jgi:glycosyltransferase involved in cell wall biosynthesis
MRTLLRLLRHRRSRRAAALGAEWPAPILLLAYTSQLGGAERSLLQATARLDRRLFTPILAVPTEGPLASAARARDIEVFVDGSPHLERLGPAAWLGVVERLAALVVERRVRLVHAGTVWRLTRAAAVAWLTRVPAICHVRDEDIGLFRSLRFRVAARRMQRLIAISSSVMHELVAAGQHPLHVPVLWNGLDAAPFEAASGASRLRGEWGIEADAPVVGMVGSIEPRKGQIDFVRAAGQVALARPDARFVVVGSDLHGVWKDYRAELEREIDQRELRERWVFAGQCDDVADVMAAFDVLVEPSHREPFGRVVIEGMAAARPVVAYGVGGICEIVQPGITGVLCEPGDAADVGAEVVALLADPARARAMGEAGRARVRERFSLDRHVADLEIIYRGILGNALTSR